MLTHASTLKRHHSNHRGDSIQKHLSPVFAQACHSESLLVSRHTVMIEGHLRDIPRLMLLGQRGGGKSIRIAIFAGFEDAGVDGIEASTQLLLKLNRQLSLAKDFALFVYPTVNLRAFGTRATSWQDFERAFRYSPADEEAQFYKSEFRTWHFDGLLALRTNPCASHFQTTAYSDVIAREVAVPAAAATLDANNSVSVQARSLSFGSFKPDKTTRPQPFALEITSPTSMAFETRVNTFVTEILEALHAYRRLISHAADL